MDTRELKNTHYCKSLAQGRQMRVDISASRALAWYDRPGRPPLLIGVFDTPAAAVAMLDQLEQDLTRLRRLHEEEIVQLD
jgi:hypothetical protein